MKNICLLISGTPRTFVIEEQIIFFNKLKELLELTNNLDIYIYLKLKDNNNNCNYIKSIKGIDNLKRQIKNLKPIYYNIINEIESEFDKQKFNIKNQLFMINNLLKESEKNKKYDWYIRIRPDYQFNLNNFNFLFDKLDEEVIYTSPKFDSIGNDQFFYFSYHNYNNWWKKNYNNFIKKNNIPPEYIIFNNVKTIQNKNINGFLIRNYNKVLSWNYKIEENNNYNFIFNNEKKYYEKSIEDELFNNLIKEI